MLQVYSWCTHKRQPKSDGWRNHSTFELDIRSAGDDTDFQTPEGLLPLCSLLANVKTQNSMYQCGFTVCWKKHYWRWSFPTEHHDFMAGFRGWNFVSNTPFSLDSAPSHHQLYGTLKDHEGLTLWNDMVFHTAVWMWLQNAEINIFKLIQFWEKCVDHNRFLFLEKLPKFVCVPLF